ncbi:hypothetical protein TTHERM_00035170 (macronuclear) [Tetrahymena thermophila SB210]|uniref:Uncharacterized protein n=1 Tax=Tetrahymena thermophila (strain SB210) TaxID=312017 RepID=Q22MK3_TETTS|nr:hypothetical protein TTHERM_00035170 [Tetrahymena thermophila SB210]EAR86319.2 hypothetical protein TTHERM_00035170 [Tetrahymena thermophila SB210]|eukprot:XP_977017.2 hypothetical protein TTHERM_00035170 [Tetrahymena thermophila SB210]
MQQIYEEKINRLQILLVQNVLEKMYYKKQWNDRRRFLDAGLKIISDKLNALTIEQNELYNEIADLNDESQSSLQTILEQQEGFETEHHNQIDSYEEMFEDIYKQISLISDTQGRLINKYKIELQSMAYEVKQMKLDESERLLQEQQKNKKIKNILQQDQQDFQALYNEEKDKLQELECKFDRLQQDFEELQQISQKIVNEKKGENINEAQIKQNVETLVKEIKMLEDKCIEYENEIKDKNKQLKNLRTCQSNLKQENLKLEEDIQEKMNNKELSEGKQKKMQREITRLSQVIERKEKEILRLEEKIEEIQNSEKERVQGYIQEIEDLTVENEKLKQEANTLAKSNKLFQAQMKKYESAEQITKQITEREQQLKELQLQYKELELKYQAVKKEADVTLSQKELHFQKAVNQLEQNHKKQMEEVKLSNQQQINNLQSQFKQDKEKFEKEAIQYLNYKDEEINKLRKQINISSSISSQNLSGSKENNPNQQSILQQSNVNNQNSIKDLQNLLIILSKDLRNKEKEIEALKQQLQQQPLQQISQNRLSTSQSYENKQSPRKRKSNSQVNDKYLQNILQTNK